MKLKVNTATFQNMVAKAVNGAGMNNEYSITHQMAIQLKNNTLMLITTDNINYLYVIAKNVAGDDFYVVVPISKFSKLIAKLTCEDVELELKSGGNSLDKLEVIGNGRHTIELEYDEEGELIEFPDPLVDAKDKAMSETVIHRSTIQLILSTAKSSVLPVKDVTKASPYVGYYVGDKIVTTDSYKICGIDVKVFDEPKLLPQSLVNLLDVLTQEEITVMYDNDTVIFDTDDTVVYGHTMEGIDKFNIDAISALLDEKFPSSCKVDRSLLLQLLDRSSLFVDSIDKNSVYLTFTKEGLEVSNKRGKGEELIPYVDSKNFSDYTCCLNIGMLQSQVKAYPLDNVEILYGKESIKFATENVKQIIALMEDDRQDQKDEVEE